MRREHTRHSGEKAMTEKMRERILAALRAAIVEIEAGRLSGIEFYSCRLEHDVAFHGTPAQAEDDMEDEITRARDEASDGWDESAGSIQWGIAVPVVVHDELDMGPASGFCDFDTMLDYVGRDWLGRQGQCVAFDPVEAYADGRLPIYHDGEYWFSHDEGNDPDPVATISYSSNGGWAWEMAGVIHHADSYGQARKDGNIAAAAKFKLCTGGTDDRN